MTLKGHYALCLHCFETWTIHVYLFVVLHLLRLFTFYIHIVNKVLQMIQKIIVL